MVSAPPNSVAPMTIKPAVAQILNQISDLLEHLSNDEYSKASVTLNGSTVGQHVRHTLEFFKCLFDGAAISEVNYDLRGRDIFLESNTLQAQVMVGDLLSKLERLDLEQNLDLCQSYGENEADIVRVKSNTKRELVYNIEHAVHHMALIRIGLKEIKPSFQVADDFGVASSTARYNKARVVSQ